MISNQPAGQKEKTAERRLKALELRKSGASYRQIASALGISESTAHNDVLKMLRSIAKRQEAEAAVVLALELEKLDALEVAIASQIKVGNLGAVDRKLKIMDRRARYLGLDAPVETDQTHHFPDLEEHAQSLQRKLAALAAASGADSIPSQPDT